MDVKLPLQRMKCLGLNLFDNLQNIYTHPLCRDLKNINLDESNIFDLMRQL